ncbi:MAG: DUF167 domain-containing protein [Gemmatimonadaceae bacterium]
MTGLVVRERGGGVRFDVRVQPRASRTEIAGVHGQALKVRVNAPPVDGSANAAVVTLLADRLGVPRSAIRVVAGATSRIKIIEVSGVRPQDILRLVST